MTPAVALPAMMLSFLCSMVWRPAKPARITNPKVATSNESPTMSERLCTTPAVAVTSQTGPLLGALSMKVVMVSTLFKNRDVHPKFILFNYYLL